MIDPVVIKKLIKLDFYIKDIDPTITTRIIFNKRLRVYHTIGNETIDFDLYVNEDNSVSLCCGCWKCSYHEKFSKIKQDKEILRNALKEICDHLPSYGLFSD